MRFICQNCPRVRALSVSLPKLVRGFAFCAPCCRNLSEGSRSVGLAAQTCLKVHGLCVLLVKSVRGFAFWASCWPNLSEGSRSAHLAGQHCPRVHVLGVLLSKLVRGLAVCASCWQCCVRLDLTVAESFAIRLQLPLDCVSHVRRPKKTFLIQVHIIDSTIKLRPSFFKFATQACPRVRRLCVLFAKTVRGFAL